MHAITSLMATFSDQAKVGGAQKCVFINSQARSHSTVKSLLSNSLKEKIAPISIHNEHRLIICCEFLRNKRAFFPQHANRIAFWY